MTSTLKVLVAARELLSDEKRWAKGNLAHDVDGDNTNDDPNITHADILRVLDAAIAHADVLRALDAAIERAQS